MLSGYLLPYTNRYMIKKTFEYLGAEANARAVASITTITAIIGSILVFVFLKIFPLFWPGLSNSGYDEGYRAGRREIELEYRVRRLEEQINNAELSRKIRQRVEGMTLKELDEELSKWTSK